MFESLKKVRAWVSVDGTWDTGANGPESQSRGAGSSLCPVHLHDLRLLLRKLSSGQRKIPIYGTCRHVASPPIQRQSGRRLRKTGEASSCFGQGRDRWLRQCSELCQSLPKEHSVNRIFSSDWPGSDETIPQGFFRVARRLKSRSFF